MNFSPIIYRHNVRSHISVNRLQLHAESFGDSHALSHGQVKHDFLGTTRDGVGTDITVQTLDLATLSTTRVGETTEDLRSLTGAELEGDGSLSLERGNGATKAQHGLGLAHLLALVDKVLKPVVRSLDLAGHVSKLHADDRVLHELLAESATLVGVLDALLEADTREAQRLDDNTHALVVEVGHDDAETLVLLAEQVLNGDLDILEGDVGSTRGPDTLAVHAAGADTLTTLDEEERDAVHAGAASADGSGEVVGPDTVGDPLLLTVDDEVLAILAQLSLASKVGDITSSIRLSNGQADTLVTAQDTGHDAVLEGLGTELHDGRAANTETTNQVPDETTGTSAGQLISDNHLVEEIPLLSRDRLDASSILCGVLHTQETGEVTATAHLLVDLLGDTLSLIPLGDKGLEIVLNPLADFVAESSVGLVEVRRRVLRRLLV